MRVWESGFRVELAFRDRHRGLLQFRIWLLEFEVCVGGKVSGWGTCGIRLECKLEQCFVQGCTIANLEMRIV